MTVLASAGVDRRTTLLAEGGPGAAAAVTATEVAGGGGRGESTSTDSVLVVPADGAETPRADGVAAASQDAAKGAKPPRPLGQRLPGMFVTLFLTGMVVLLAFGVAQVVLIAGGQEERWRGVGFVLANTLGTCWVLFAVFFTLSWAPTVWHMYAVFALTALDAGLICVWLYVYYNALTCAVVAALTGMFLMVGRNARHIFVMIAAQPFNPSLGFWFEMLKMWAIISAPIVATYLRVGSSTSVSYFTLMAFTLPAAYLSSTVRVDFAKHPGTLTLDALLYKLSRRRLFSVYLPATLMFVIFALLYVVVAAGLDRSGADLSVFLIVVGSLFVVCVAWSVLFGSLADYSPRGSWVHSVFSSLSPAQYELLVRNAEMQLADVSSYDVSKRL